MRKWVLDKMKCWTCGEPMKEIGKSKNSIFYICPKCGMCGIGINPEKYNEKKRTR